MSNNEINNLCLVDFGLSTKKYEKPIFLKCGTPGYIAPELLKARSISSYSEQVDMFSEDSQVEVHLATQKAMSFKKIEREKLILITSL